MYHDTICALMVVCWWYFMTLVILRVIIFRFSDIFQNFLCTTNPNKHISSIFLISWSGRFRISRKSKINASWECNECPSFVHMLDISVSSAIINLLYNSLCYDITQNHHLERRHSCIRIDYYCVCDSEPLCNGQHTSTWLKNIIFQ